MSDDTEMLIRDIATRHGVLIGKDDPILILQTMNQRLMEEHVRAQDKLLNQFKSCLEEMVARQEHESRDKSERILNASLLAAREASQFVLGETTESVRIALGGELDIALKTINSNFHSNQKIAWMQFTASAITALSVIVFIIALYLH